MSNSFKLDTSQNTKQQLVSGGVFLIILSVILMFVWDLGLGLLGVTIGALMALAGRFAS